MSDKPNADEPNAGEPSGAEPNGAEPNGDKPAADEPGPRESIPCESRTDQLSADPASSPTLRDVQRQVDEWINTIGVRYFSELTNVAQLMEEVGEVARVISRTYGEQSFKKSDHDVRLDDELADVLFVLVCLANQTGIDLSAAFHRNMEKKTARDRDRHRNNPRLTDTT